MTDKYPWLQYNSWKQSYLLYRYILRYVILIICQSAILYRREWRLWRTRASMIGSCYFLNIAAVVCGLPSITVAADHVAWSVIHSESYSTVLRNGTNGASRVLWMKSWKSYGDWLTTIDFPRHLILHLYRGTDRIHLFRTWKPFVILRRSIDSQSRSWHLDIHKYYAESPKIYHRRD